MRETEKRGEREGCIYHTQHVSTIHTHSYLRVKGINRCEKSPAESNHTARTSGDSVFFLILCLM